MFGHTTLIVFNQLIYQNLNNNNSFTGIKYDKTNSLNDVNIC